MAKYQGRTVKLNKPFRQPSGSSKKFGVYVKNKSTGRIKKVGFGDPNMKIKKNIPARQKSFLARMGGILKDVKGQKSLSPAYWSMRSWRKGFKV
tara:strand:+ start:284 stop:565 length:282 start_codon:yes stop_codon:yes gene_type:complete